jgi:predicted SprT family Zn-dependent metalloprotease
MTRQGNSTLLSAREEGFNEPEKEVATEPRDGVTPSTVANHAEREQWLYQIADALYAKFAALGFSERPNIRIGVGYPSTGSRGKRVGECHHFVASKDRVHEIIISPIADDTLDVGGIVAHELCHAFLQSYFPDENCGHGKKFKKLATALGLTGKMRSTVPGEAFKRFLRPIVETIGQYPHGALGTSATTRKVQSTRLRKVFCSSCQYTMRVTQKWIDTATPKCPTPDCGLCGEEMEVA